MDKIDHIVAFSGGHSSAIVAVEVVRRYGKESVILLNHDINPNLEDPDIKRFKNEVAKALGLEITYANYDGITDASMLPDQFDISIKKKGFKSPMSNNAFCTHELKTKPFHKFLELNYSDKNCIIYYGFDDDEQERINRREFILGEQGYKTDFPLARWVSTIENIEEIGVQRPLQYSSFKNANCVGCLKAGIQQWYVTFCHRPDIYDKASETEKILGYSILQKTENFVKRSYWLAELQPVFQRMKCEGVPQSQHYSSLKFKRYLKQYKLPVLELFSKPCECSF